jgi:SAM-dependent methyltransferase
MQTFLHVGCNDKPKDKTTPGFATADWAEVRFDIDPSVNPDIVGDMKDMHTVADGTFDAVFSSHNIEHLFIHEVPTALSEFRRVLKPHGFVILTCPDLQATAVHIANGQLMEPIGESPAGPVSPHDTLYGWGKGLAAGSHFMAHRCGFTAASLTKFFVDAGFGTVLTRRRPDWYDLWVVATKSKCPEAIAKFLASEHLPPP